MFIYFHSSQLIDCAHGSDGLRAIRPMNAAKTVACSISEAPVLQSLLCGPRLGHLPNAECGHLPRRRAGTYLERLHILHAPGWPDLAPVERHSAPRL